MCLDSYHLAVLQGCIYGGSVDLQSRIVEIQGVNIYDLGHYSHNALAES